MMQKNTLGKHQILFIYAFFKSDGRDGVHEDICTDMAKKEALEHAKKIWVDADEYEISEKQLINPFYFFSKKKKIK